MKMLKTKLLPAILLALLPMAVMAQGFSGYNWYFGNSPNGIRFSRSTDSATLVSNQAVPFGTGGSAVASDQVNGNLLFYTDGNDVFDVSHTVMPNGTGLGANTSGNQAVAIAKVPGQATQYYVFVNNANFTAGGTISFRIIDMALFGNAIFPAPALGDATTAANTAVPGLTGRSEAMITIPHANGDDFWLITHTNGAPDYVVTLFTPTGPTTTTTFAGLGLILTAANFSYHPGTNQIAVSPQETTRDVEILSFDPATGVLGFQQRVLSSGIITATNQAIYDTEWSESGQYLYISINGEPGIQADVLQYDFASPLTSLTSVLPQPNTIFQSYGLQMAPDSSIYHLYQATAGGPILVGRLTNTDTVASFVTYTPEAFPLNTNFAGTQFPSFAPSDTLNLIVSFVPDGFCANAPTAFFPTVTPGADSLRWSFGDGSGSADWSPVYTYTAGGSYTVSVTAFLNGQTATSSQPITITDFDTQISLVQDTTACSCELPFPKAPNPPPRCGTFSVTAQVNGTGTPTYQWYGPAGLIAGATSLTLQPDSAGYYYLVATVGSCATYAGVNIKEYDVQDQRANIWYFGNRAGLDFNPLPENPVVPISNPVMNAPEGTSTISDHNGQVIFFTDGDKVWNRANVEIATGIGGDPGSSQAAIIIPVPGDETLYYIFTTQEVHGTNTYELRYSLFDLKMNGGTGGLIEQDVLLFARCTERITGNGNWLIAHEYGNNSFRAYRISNLGIGNPVISSIGSDHALTSAENGQGYMKLGPQDRLAVALSTPGTSNVVEVFDFSDSTGLITNFRTADLNNPNGQVYGVEFSPGGNKLYATLRGATSQVVEFAFDSTGAVYLKKPPIAPVPEELGAIQIGPDGQLYVAVNGEQFLGTIQANEDTTQVSTFQLNGFGLLAGTNSNLGLPNFIQNLSDPTTGPSISIAGACIQDSVRFQGTPTDPIDVFFWQVRLGGTVVTTSDQEQFSFLFTTPGLYDVSLRLTNRCGLDTTMTRQHLINGVPPDPTTSVVLCTGSQILDANPLNVSGLTYLWSTGDTTRTITVNRQAIYRVTITGGGGCTTDGQILAVDNRPVTDLGSDLTICQNTPIAPLNAQNPGATYAWTINGVPSGASQTQSVDTSVPGPPTYEYEVLITDPITTCTFKDSVIFTINASPAFTAAGTNPSSCIVNDGSINLSITAPANTLFSYFITGPATSLNGTDQTLGALPAATGLDGGTYGITVNDQVSGCTTISTVTLNDPAFTVTGIPNAVCDPIGITVTTSVPQVNVTYRVLDNATAAVVETGGPLATTPFNTSAAGLLSNNSYIVEVSAAGCTASSLPVLINQAVTLPIAFDITDICNQNITAVSPGATTFDWSISQAGSVNTPTNLATINVNPGTWLLRVRVDDGAGPSCPTTDSLAVTVEPPIVADFTQTDACADQVTINATPATGSFLYRWFRNGVLDLTLAGPQITATAANDGQSYFVRVVSTASGCQEDSPTKTVEVDGLLGVTLTSSTACEGSPFTLTAVPSRTSTFQWAIDGATIPGQSGSTLQDQRAGTYTVTAIAATCSTSTDLQVLLAPTTPGLLNDQALICPDPANPDPNTREVTLYPGDFDTYDWFKDGVGLGINTPTLVASEAGIYSVALLNSFGCASSDKTDVVIQCDPVIVGPNAFRPTSVLQQGGDFVNQSFKLFTFFIDDSDFQVFIFNRWGEMIYQSNQREFRWNGGYNNNIGQLAPAGTYSYVVRYKSSYRPEKGIQETRGGVVLLR